VLSRLTCHVRHNAVAYLALFVALGGSSYAAVTLPANSVGAKQIKQGAVRSSKVKDASLLAADFKAGQLPAGPRGIPGVTGATGPQGTPGVTGATGAPGATNVVVRSITGTNFGTATCNPGERATGGGFNITGGGLPNIYESRPSPDTAGAVPTGWYVSFASNTSAVTIYVVCASP
jgi:hypothetical protein